MSDFAVNVTCYKHVHCYHVLLNIYACRPGQFSQYVSNYTKGKFHGTCPAGH